MKEIIIDVGKQLDGFTFRLNPLSRIKLKEKFPEISPVSSVFVSYDTYEEKDFGMLDESVWKYVALMLTGFSENQFGKSERFVFLILLIIKKYLKQVSEMSKKANLYLGKAGQMGVMSEFLARGWNVAVPEVDVGDDIFVVRDSDGNLSRVQVKTGSAKEIRNGYGVQFSVPLNQLTFPVSPELSYVFAVRRNQLWESFVIIQRDILNEEYQFHNVGSRTTHNRLTLYMSFFQEKVVCSKRDFTVYLNRWDRWKPIVH